MKDQIEYAFKGLITITMFLCVFILKDFDKSLDQMQKSVSKLNISLAVMSEKLVFNSARYNEIERRLTVVENLMEERTKDRWTRKDHESFTKYLEKELKTIKKQLEKQ